MSDEDQRPGSGPRGTACSGPGAGTAARGRTRRDAPAARAIGVALIGVVVAVSLSACGTHGRGPNTGGAAAGTPAGTVGTANGPAPAGTPGAATPGARMSPTTATISQDDVNELQAALGDAESLTNDVESDMAKDTSQ